MGEVYLAEDKELERRVAVKLLPAEVARDAERMRRFVQEAKTASALNHPNILTVHEIGQSDGVRFIVTEFVRGETLCDRLRRAPAEVRESLEIALQIAAALAAAHESGIVHRDIKPENVMVRDDGLVKVLDFGLAKLTEKKTEDIDGEAATRAQVKTQAGVILGTIAYMSPEQARGLTIDARADVWSLGVCLYEMLTGRQPFTGATTSDTIAAILKTDPAPLDENMLAELRRIVTKTLQKSGDERYQTVKDLAVDLRQLKKHLEVEAEIERTASPHINAGAETKVINAATTDAARSVSSAEYIAGRISEHKLGFAVGVAVLVLATAAGFWFYGNRAPDAAPIDSIAVLPFQNASGNLDVEYLSDGMTESLINSLSQLPKLNVKARSSVFRYKGKAVEAQQVASELSVQAILTGRVVQRGDDLALYLSLVDARNGNQLWGEQYDRKLADLVALQSEITRDVSQKLRARLSGADEQKLTKDYTANTTANTEAYRLYLKGRYHVFKLTPPEVQAGISYFQQAIEIDPSYALAYVGLAEAYRSLALAGEMSPTEFLPKAKAAANKAIEIDDRLAEAHTALGVSMFWYDWDWNAVENQYKRALELKPNSADTHLFYAHLLSNTGRHPEALAEIKRARELDPLSPFVNALEGQFLLHAGRTDEALASLQKTFELAPNFWFPHLFAASAYTEKGMYREAVVEARRAKELSPVLTVSVSIVGYALAKSGKRDEARAVLDELLKLSTERFVPPYHIAVIYNGLGETDKATAWLEKGYEQRDPKMAFLKVEPKWNNLRDDPRFQDLLRRVGFPQ